MPPRPAKLKLLSLRTATAADAAGLAALDEACFPAVDRFSRRVWRHLLGPARRNRSSLTLVAEGEGRLLGSINLLFRRGSSVARLYTLAVHPDARGRGLAKRMLAAVLALAPRRCRELSLEVRHDNPARSLYDAWGMQVVADLPGYYRDGAAGVRMRARLADLAPSLAEA
jgi:ribosomal protein S18 acetylase RimI-like enzyme